jgi:hypothetical protein
MTLEYSGYDGDQTSTGKVGEFRQQRCLLVVKSWVPACMRVVCKYFKICVLQGKEFIRIVKSRTTVPLAMYAFAYETGSANITYAYAPSRSDCCLGE